MKRTSALLLLAIASLCVMAQRTLEVTVSNPLSLNRQYEPVVLDLKQYTADVVRSALVTQEGREVPCQLDDLDGDGNFDQLCFLTDIGKKEWQRFTVQLSSDGDPRQYEAKVYADMMLINRKVKSKNKQDFFISSLTVDKGTNPYSALHHHGPAFESELVAYRLYFDHRQTIDLYGKYHKGLELQQTQFYTDSVQKAAGYGDDVLWVGSSFGCGALRGWDGQDPQMLTDVDQRTMRLVSRGPLRTILEVIDANWKPTSESERLTLRTLYILYAGHRDVAVEATVTPTLVKPLFATGLVNVKNSEEFSDHKGLRGCWGSDWTVSAKDTLGHKRETVGLGICIPRQYVAKELVADKDNYPFVVQPVDRRLDYFITFCSDNETFGYHSAKEWFACLRSWKELLMHPVKVSVATK